MILKTLLFTLLGAVVEWCVFYIFIQLLYRKFLKDYGKDEAKRMIRYVFEDNLKIVFYTFPIPFINFGMAIVFITILYFDKIDKFLESKREKVEEFLEKIFIGK